MKIPLRFLYRLPILLILSLCFCSLNPDVNECCAANTKSLLNKAQRYYWGKKVKQDYQKALQLYEQAALLGDPVGQFIAGGMYYTGKGTRKNMQKAYLFLSQAAKQGKTSPEAEMALAEMYIAGSVAPRDYQKAEEYLTQAAKSGNAEAQNELAFMYFIGNGVNRDFNLAMDWFGKAARQGLVIAQFNLGMMWYLGNSDKGNDLKKAYAWLGIASLGGHQGAANVQKYIEQLLIEEELRDSRQISFELYNKYYKKNF